LEEAIHGQIVGKLMGKEGAHALLEKLKNATFRKETRGIVEDLGEEIVNIIDDLDAVGILVLSRIEERGGGHVGVEGFFRPCCVIQLLGALRSTYGSPFLRDRKEDRNTQGCCKAKKNQDSQHLLSQIPKEKRSFGDLLESEEKPGLPTSQPPWMLRCSLAIP
jgi:hypothetical protein